MCCHLRGDQKHYVDGLIHPDEERLPEYPPGVRGLRLLAHRFPIRLQGRLGLFAWFTIP
jgi:hypothetical protein